MNPSDDPAASLARRLKALRLGGLGGRRITQLNLAEALSASPPLISSWESTTKPAIPPQTRLEAYATFFATERSVVGRKFRLLPLSELTPDERAAMDDLLRELVVLREAALGSDGRPATPRGRWQFQAGESVTIICAELPDDRKEQMPYANPDNPDYIRCLRFSDLDALIELYGYIRAVNSASQVNIRTSKELVPEDYTAHLAVLGGVDWNPVTSELLKTIGIPLRQIERAVDADIGGFKIADGQEFTPELSSSGTLQSDVAHFYRGPNPFNKQRTVTICNGMYGRGTLGAVRALTDPRFRDRNEAYVRERFAYPRGFSILTRVKIVNGEVVPPDWTSSDVRLHEWQEEPGDAASGSVEPFDHGDASPSRLPSGTVSPAHGGSEQPVGG